MSIILILYIPTLPKHKTHLPVSFPRESGSPSPRELFLQRTLMNVLKKTIPPSPNTKLTYWFHFQESPGVQVQENRSYKKKRMNVNERS